VSSCSCKAIYFALGRGSKYCGQCDDSLFVCLSARKHISRIMHLTFTIFLRVLHMSMAQSSSRDIAICYVVPVLWMTSYFIMGHRSIYCRVGSARCSQSRLSAQVQPGPRVMTEAVHLALHVLCLIQVLILVTFSQSSSGMVGTGMGVKTTNRNSNSN